MPRLPLRKGALGCGRGTAALELAWGLAPTPASVSTGVPPTAPCPAVAAAGAFSREQPQEAGEAGGAAAPLTSQEGGRPAGAGGRERARAEAVGHGPAGLLSSSVLDLGPGKTVVDSDAHRRTRSSHCLPRLSALGGIESSSFGSPPISGVEQADLFVTARSRAAFCPSSWTEAKTQLGSVVKNWTRSESMTVSGSAVVSHPGGGLRRWQQQEQRQQHQRQVVRLQHTAQERAKPDALGGEATREPSPQPRGNIHRAENVTQTFDARECRLKPTGGGEGADEEDEEGGRVCTACGRRAAGGTESIFFCPCCGALMPVEKSVNFFNIFRIPESYALDEGVLEQRYKSLQKRLHPDLYASNPDEDTRLRSAAWSALVIDAYYTLLRPLSRAKYMLSLQASKGSPTANMLSEGNEAERVMDDQSMLMEIMEAREEVEDASEDELPRLKSRYEQQLTDLGMRFGKAFEADDAEECRTAVHRMSYCCRILEDISARM